MIDGLIDKAYEYQKSIEADGEKLVFASSFTTPHNVYIIG